jgi:hypothetical protein
LFKKVSFTKPEDNEDLMKSVKLVTKTITNVFRASSKSNPSLHKFLMFGISNGVLTAGDSEWNNLDVHTVLTPKYSIYFGMTIQEVDVILNSWFSISDKGKDKIKENINRWYNGYYHKDGTVLFSIFSLILYLDDWYEEYKSSGIGQEDLDVKWIPKPTRIWASSSATDVFNNYLNLGISDRFHNFLKDIYLGLPAKCIQFDPLYSPLLGDINNPMERVKIVFHVLVHSGYLTKLSDGSNRYKIPNYEIRSELDEQIDQHLSCFINNDIVRKLSNAAVTENYKEFGEEITKSLFKYISSNEAWEYDKSGDLSVVYIYQLLREVLKDIPRNVRQNLADEDEDEAERPSSKTILSSYRDGESNGERDIKINFLLTPIDQRLKTHYVIELERDNSDKQGMIKKALKALNKIFEKDYHLQILPLLETKQIINMGCAIKDNHVSLIVLKVHVNNGQYIKTDDLLFQKFEVVKTNEGRIRIDITKQVNLPLEFSDRLNISNSSHSVNDQLKEYNKAAREAIIGKIKMIENSPDLENLLD